MGCASSKGVGATALDVYRPAPASYVFDINAIEEPWLKLQNDSQVQLQEKPTHVPAPILEKFDDSDVAPRSWDEVSKALEHLKPTLHQKSPLSISSPVKPESLPSPEFSPLPQKRLPRKSFSFHTLEELDAKASKKPGSELKKSESMTKLNLKPVMKSELKKSESMTKLNLKPAMKSEFNRSETESTRSPSTESVVSRSLKENIFIMKDRMEREREGKETEFEKMIARRRNPLIDIPEKCPPGGGDTVVLYTTSLGGVRRTYEDCNRLRTVLEGHRVVFDERDVSMHGQFLNELKELLGEGVSVPRLFVKGRYIGGVEEAIEINELGKLGRIFNAARIEKGVGRMGCEGCGGARFVPCLECGGSCKVVVDGERERCGKCNENGLVHCPSCA